jgi:RNA polymerase sigma-70 factor (ECF subfamily)
LSYSEKTFLEATLPHLDAVHAIARRLCSDRSRAEDIVQETYLRAFAGFAGYKGDGTRAWLSAICVNVVRTEWRRQGSRVQEATMDEEQNWADEARRADVARSVEANIDRETISRALSRLPEEQRVAIVLMDLAGNTASEVAAILGAPRGTVLARAHRGRRKLAQILKAEGAGIDLL